LVTESATVTFIGKEHLFKYYSIAFSILPSIAGGLALELYPQTMKTALGKMQKQMEKARQEKDSRIIVP